MPEHTKTPWRVSPDNHYRVTGGCDGKMPVLLGWADDAGVALLDIAHAVRCVNAHDELVAELRATRDELDNEHHGIGLGGYCPLCARYTHITELLAKMEADDE